MELLLPSIDSTADQRQDLQLISKELKTALDREFQFNHWVQICVFYSLQFHLPVFAHLLSILKQPSQVLPVTIRPEQTDKCDWKSSLSINITLINKAGAENVWIKFRYNATYSVQLLSGATVNENGKVYFARMVLDSLDPNNSVSVLTVPDFYSIFESKGSSQYIFGFQGALVTAMQQFFKSKMRIFVSKIHPPAKFPKYAMKVIDTKEFPNASLLDSR